MNQGPEEQLNTPLEDVLANLPEEESPEGLEERCRQALDEVTPAVKSRLQWEPWRQLMAAAAVLVMVVGAGNLFTGGRVREKIFPPQRPRAIETEMPVSSVPRYATKYEAAAPQGPAVGTPAPSAPRGPAGPDQSGNDTKAALNAAGVERTTVNGWSNRPSTDVQRRLAQDAASGAVAGGPAALSAAPPPALPPGVKPTGVQGWIGETPPQVKRRLGVEVAQSSGPRAPAAYAPGGPPTATPRAPSQSYNNFGVSQANKPWLDQSDTRRKMTSRSIELETPRVEETYKQATTLIEKAGGYLTQENLSILRKSRSTANLQARIPVGQFDGVVAQIRDLGKLVRLTGESQDRTEEYQFEGTSIRELGAREEQLAAQYKAEDKTVPKARLKRQLEAVRQQLAATKDAMRSLHHEVSYAQLSLTITEARGLRAIVKSAAEQALPLAFSLALIAVPLLVLALIWKRKS